MIISHQYDINTQLHELGLVLSKDNYRYMYFSPSLGEMKKLDGICNWLNKCFQENDEKETPSQSV